MENIPQTLKYTATHEWVARDDNNIICVGITDHAQKLLGDVVFVELPKVGDKVSLGKEFGVVESVKAASDLYSPIAGEIVAINESLAMHPEQINQDPYETGWMIKIKADDLTAWENLLDAKTYQEKIGKGLA
jgi:glycine cleavage system H protein